MAKAADQAPAKRMEVSGAVAMCFQHFNLFPHLTILENCTLAPIWVWKIPGKEAEETAMHFLEKAKIPEQADKYLASCRAASCRSASSSVWPSPARCACVCALCRSKNRPGPRSGDDQGSSGYDD